MCANITATHGQRTGSPYAHDLNIDIPPVLHVYQLGARPSFSIALQQNKLTDQPIDTFLRLESLLAAANIRHQIADNHICGIVDEALQMSFLKLIADKHQAHVIFGLPRYINLDSPHESFQIIFAHNNGIMDIGNTGLIAAERVRKGSWDISSGATVTFQGHEHPSGIIKNHMQAKKQIVLSVQITDECLQEYFNFVPTYPRKKKLKKIPSNTLGMSMPHFACVIDVKNSTSTALNKNPAHILTRNMKLMQNHLKLIEVVEENRFPLVGFQIYSEMALLYFAANESHSLLGYPDYIDDLYPLLQHIYAPDNNTIRCYFRLTPQTKIWTSGKVVIYTEERQ